MGLVPFGVDTDCTPPETLGLVPLGVRGRVLSVIAVLIVCGLTGTALAAIPSLTAITSWTTYRHDSGRSGFDPRQRRTA